MTVTIPEWALWLPLWYVLVGVAATLPLLAWANSGVSPRQSWHHGAHSPRSWAASAIAWPFLIWDLWITPRRNRKVLQRWRDEISR